MTYQHVLVSRDGDHATITMNRPEQRNALSLQHLQELTKAFEEVGATDATGIVVAGNGSVFSAGASCSRPAPT
jgi:enoyl-CoA hydratase/carnithine racemase